MIHENFEDWVDGHLDLEPAYNEDYSINYLYFRRPEVEAAYAGYRAEMGMTPEAIDWAKYENA
ncbi:MAG: hypothetical protein WAV95_15835 [Azonexus sp.]